MSNNTYKSAAVPFVNQKGERSMKRVKVERYVAGKKPAYAKDDDEEEYYTTDEEEESQEEEESYVQEEEDQQNHQHLIPNVEDTQTLPRGQSDINNDQEDDDDDPRFRKLKQLEKSSFNAKQLFEVQTRFDEKDRIPTVIHDDEDEEEEEIRQRHAIARARSLEEPVGPQVILGELNDVASYSSTTDLNDDTSKSTRREQTEDILGDLKIVGIRRNNDSEIMVNNDKIKDMVETARQESIMAAQLVKQMEEDNKRDQEREARSKMDINANDMDSVNTDDEDDEAAYEEWKAREIKRVLRDKSERELWKREQARC